MPKTKDDNEKTAPPMMDEADIGSGEKSPGQHETEEIIRQIPTLPPSKDGQGQPANKA